MLPSRAAAADARGRQPPVSSGVTLPLRFLRKSIACVAGVLARPRFDAKRADLGAHHLHKQSRYRAAQLGTADMGRAVLVAVVLAAASSFAPVAV